MPLSDDPDKRARQLANLRPGAGKWAPGTTLQLKHGARSRRPSPLVLDPLAEEIAAQLAEDLPLRSPDGSVPRPARPMLEAAALDGLIVRRIGGYLATHGDVDPQTGKLRPELELLGKANDRYASKLKELGCGLRSAAALGVDLKQPGAVDPATALSLARQEPDPEARRALLKEAGVLDDDV